MKDKVKTRDIINRVYSFLLSSGIFVVLYLRCGAFFETNDDRVITEILSGSLTGTPDAHAIHIHYFLGLLLKELYLLVGNVQWWGLFLTICFVVSVAVIFNGILSKASSLLEYCFVTVVCLVISFANVYHYTVFEFTTIAGILAVASWFSLICSQDKRKGIIGFVVLNILAYFVRADAMLFVQPIGMMVWGTIAIAERQWKKEEIIGIIQNGIKLIMIVLVIVVSSWCTNHFIGYGTEEWREFSVYNEARVYLVDYSSNYSYEQIEDILDDYGVSREEFDLALRHYWVVDNYVDSNCVEKVADRIKEINKENALDIKTIFNKAVTYGEQDGIREFHKNNRYLILLVGISIVLHKKWKFFLIIWGIDITKLSLLVYLIYSGRYPIRVTSILYFAEMVFYILILLRLKQYPFAKQWKRVLICAAIVGTCYSMFSTSLLVYYRMREKNNIAEIYSREMVKFYDYFDDKSGGYIFSQVISMYYTGDIFDTAWYQHRNIVISGGWFSNAPFVLEYEREYLREHAGDIAVVFLEGDGKREEVCSLIEQKYGMQLECVDSFDLDIGNTYLVYKMNK